MELRGADAEIGVLQELEALLFYNAGVKLVGPDSPVRAELMLLEENGITGPPVPNPSAAETSPFDVATAMRSGKPAVNRCAAAAERARCSAARWASRCRRRAPPRRRAHGTRTAGWERVAASAMAACIR